MCATGIAGGGGLEALKNAMIMAALPFTFIMVLMALALAKALYRDGLRDRQSANAVTQPA